jgi:hypothetical protein
MAISSGQVVVGLTPIGINGVSRNPSRIHVHNNDNTKVLYLGGSSVSTTNGLALQKLESIELTLNAGEALYAISETGTHTISWLRQTQD